MKQLLIYPISIVTIIIILLSGCDNSSIVKDIPPPSNSQITVPGSANQLTSDSTSYIPNQYLIIYKDRWDGKINNAVAQEALAFVNARINSLGIPDNKIKSRYEYALRGFSAKLTEGQLKILRADPRVDYIEQDQRFRAINKIILANNTNSILSSVEMASQTTPWGINRLNAPRSGIGKKAWILDTGVDLDHPDLNVDQNNSVSFVAQENADDFYGHGTHVAGIIAAKDNSRDMVGVAAGASVVSVKVLDQDGNGTISDIVDGINYVAGKASNSDIINMSLRLYDPGNTVTSIDNAVINAANAGKRFTIAAGNDELHANTASPARVENTNVWTVSAYDINDNFANFSNYGNPPIEWAGPGVNIPSLWKNGGTNTISGTSMAAPHIAGLLLANASDIQIDGNVNGDPDGDSDPIGVFNIPISVYISGPALLDNGEQGTWQAQVSNEDGPISYQ